jgi:serpin B
MMGISNAMTRCCAGVGVMLVGALTPHLARAQGIWPLVQAYNASGLDVFHQLAARPGNILFSPYSVGSAMAMARSGAGGATEAEMASVLHQHFSRAEAEAANSVLLKVLNSYDKSATAPSCAGGLQWTGERCESAPAADGRCPINARREGEHCVALPVHRPASAKLAIANALMLPGKSRSVSKDYENLVKDKYAAEVFAGVGPGEINAWANKNTEGKIPAILAQLDPNAQAVLLNAIYFKAHWAAKFPKTATRNDAFDLTASQRVEVPTMRETTNYAVVAGADYRAIRLPYDVGPIAMIIVLPNEIEGLAEVAKRLDADELARLTQSLNTAPAKLVALTLPRFKTNFDAALVPVFKQLGMALAFSGQADFSGMTGRPASEGSLKIDAILHRAIMDVMEEGTEAAAATAVVMFPTAAARPERPPEPEPFHIDHPFLFFIADRTTSAVLFAGRIIDPR